MVLPFAILGLVLSHILILHEKGSSSPLGTFLVTDKIAFFPNDMYKYRFGLTNVIMSLVDFAGTLDVSTTITLGLSLSAGLVVGISGSRMYSYYKKKNNLNSNSNPLDFEVPDMGMGSSETVGTEELVNSCLTSPEAARVLSIVNAEERPLPFDVNNVGLHFIKLN